jgi:hypothetical protein
VNHENDTNRFDETDPVTRSGPCPDAEGLRNATPCGDRRDEPDEDCDEDLCCDCDGLAVDDFFINLLSRTPEWDEFRSSLATRLQVANALCLAGWTPWITPEGITLEPPLHPALNGIPRLEESE